MCQGQMWEFGQFSCALQGEMTFPVGLSLSDFFQRPKSFCRPASHIPSVEEVVGDSSRTLAAAQLPSVVSRVLPWGLLRPLPALPECSVDLGSAHAPETQVRGHDSKASSLLKEESPSPSHTRCHVCLITQVMKMRAQGLTSAGNTAAAPSGPLPRAELGQRSHFCPCAI